MNNTKTSQAKKTYYQVEATESGDVIDTFDTEDEAREQLVEYVREDMSNYTIREQDGEWAVYDANGDMAEPEFIGSESACSGWIDEKCPESYYSIRRVVEDSSGEVIEAHMV